MHKIIVLVLSSILFSNTLLAQDSLLNILDEELTREFEELSKEEIPVYYLDYRLDEFQNTSISSSFGSLISSDEFNNRVLTASVRVGNYDFDNTHVMEDNSVLGMMRGYNFTIIPIDDDPFSIKSTMWKLTDRAYKESLSSYKFLVEKKKNSTSSNNTVADFSKEDVSIYYEKPLKQEIKLNIEDWEKKIKEYTLPFVDDTSILSAEAFFSFNINRRYFISSEGTKIVQNFTYAQIHIWANIKSEDGDLIPYNKSFYAYTPDGLPNHEYILQEVSDLKNKLQELKNAPVAEPYTGPAILSTKSAGVFFHEIFGHRIEADRMKSNFDGHTFKQKTGEKILLKDLSLVFDPSIKKYENTDLFGYYNYDDQGIKAQKVSIVENGILKDFLMSRTPINKGDKSNGHGRSQAGNTIISRQSNMFIETSSSYSDDELRKKLIKECKKQKKEYGYFFKEVVGGFTTTNRFIPNVFNITPIEVYKIYVDGRADELIRGVDLIGTPLTVFSKIIAAGDHKEVFNGFCGAESGSIPVSTIAPALFVEQIETQLKPISKVEIPILPRPGMNNQEIKN